MSWFAISTSLALSLGSEHFRQDDRSFRPPYFECLPNYRHNAIGAGHRSRDPFNAHVVPKILSLVRSETVDLLSVIIPEPSSMETH